MFKFLVVSDMHFMPSGQLSHAIDTARRFREAVTHINELHLDAEFCILAGDLADRGETEAYQRLAAELEGLKIPYHLTIGNHDDRNRFAEVFGNLANADTGKLDRVVDIHGQRIIILDSVEENEHHGRIAKSQLDWLDARLSEAREAPVIVVMHHNICKLMVSTDGIRLMNGDELAEALSTHKDVRAVVSGHVHLTSAGSYRGIPFTTLSGCHYNIMPRRHDPDHRAPRVDGPGQYAVVWTGEDSTVVLTEDFFNRQVLMPPELFQY